MDKNDKKRLPFINMRAFGFFALMEGHKKGKKKEREGGKEGKEGRTERRGTEREEGREKM